MSILLIVILVLALVFDYINGFHDAANSIATIVSTKVLTPFQAVIWAALFNFVAFFLFKDHGVANTIAKTVKQEYITLPVIMSGLIAAIGWNLLTWWFGIPSSSSHTLIGGFAGAAIAHAGFHSVEPEPVIKTASFIILAPVLGMIMAFVISLWFINSFKKGPAPKILAFGIMTVVGFFLSTVIVTDISKLIGMKTSTDDVNQGVKITEMMHNSSAMTMGLKKGDVILQVDHRETNSKSDLTKRLRGLGYGDDVSFMVDRKGEIKEINTKFHTLYQSRFLTTIFFGENFKWLLLGAIIFVMSIFTLFLSGLNVASSAMWLKRLQLVSSAAFSIGHGGNDAQKVMGIITAALIAGGKIASFDQMPVWVPLSCYSAIALGTMSGGWKIIKTMGTRITKVTPFEGVAAETAGAITLFITENLKIPVSTTHTITGAIIGVGATKRLSAVRWGVTISLLWAWILTIPVSGLLAAGIYTIIKLFIH
jgi:PiT family inorganic phosphate transporter